MTKGQASRAAASVARGHPDDVYLPGDLNDETFVSELADRAANHPGGVGVVVLCHGHQASSPLQEMSYRDAREVLHGNL